MTPAHRRRGVSLVEVLVVVSVCAILIALLLPAVQAARAAADRMVCRGKLRQIGLAVQNYESTVGRLPPAFQHNRPTDPSPYPHLQWPLLIAPYLELEPNWQMVEADYRKSRDVFLPTPHRGVGLPLKPFSCPSDPRTAVPWEVHFLYTLALPRPTGMTQQIAFNSYLGNAGAVTARHDGVIVADGKVTMVGIIDGTSNTLLAGERPPPADLHYGWLYVGWGAEPNGNGELSSVIGVRDPNPFARFIPTPQCGPGPFPYRQPDLTATPDCAMFQFWSLHAGGANFAFCDGSVRFLTYSADPILPALATRAGGEAAQIPE
ncbi:MAG: DUF1559 domain-containing protein [Gemmataceae bacterium]